MPLISALIILSPQIIDIFCGDSYHDSIYVLILSSPLILLVGLTYIVGMQILYPKDKTNIVVMSAVAGAIVNILLNIILLSKFKAAGASFCGMSAEVAVLLVQLLFVGKVYKLKPRWFLKKNYFIATVLMITIVLLFQAIHLDNQIISFCCCSLAGFIVYLGYLSIVKDPLLNELNNFILTRMSKTIKS